uniref:Kinesin motor domain-containing protein n=1 Tax=Bursaphelenchus xylophilus TaxID=6326 RepID=A0A1I7SPK5_BURXY
AHRTYCTFNPIPMMWVPRQASEDAFFTEEDERVRLQNDIGTFLLYCKYALVNVKDQIEEHSLCGRIYFTNGSTGGVIGKNEEGWVKFSSDWAKRFPLCAKGFSRCFLSFG